MSPSEILSVLLAELGDDIVSLGPQIAERRFADWSGLPGAMPLALLRPRDTAWVARGSCTIGGNLDQRGR